MLRISTTCVVSAVMAASLAITMIPSVAHAFETPKVTMPHVNVPQAKTPQANTHTNTPQPELLKGSLEGQTVHTGTDFHGKKGDGSPPLPSPSPPGSGAVSSAEKSAGESESAAGSLGNARGGGGPFFTKDIIALPPAPSSVVRIHPELPPPPGWSASISPHLKSQATPLVGLEYGLATNQLKQSIATAFATVSQQLQPLTAMEGGGSSGPSGSRVTPGVTPLPASAAALCPQC